MNSFLKKFNLEKILLIFFGVIILLGVFMRFQDLGYSEFQGDEIDTVEFVPEINGTAPTFKTFFSKAIFENKKGPVQYTINFFNLQIFPRLNEFNIRLPYLVFSLLSFVAIYFLSKKIYNDRFISIATLAIFASNGLQVAFSRITQYQALMFLLQPLVIYLFLVGYYKKSLKIILVSAVLFGLAFLTHYDALVLFSFFYSFLLLESLKNKKNIKICIKYAVLFTLLFAAISVPFYFFYLHSDFYENTTSAYLGRRLLGYGFMPRVPLVLNIIIHLYMPKVFWLIFFLLVNVAFIPLLKNLGSTRVLFLNLSKKVVVTLYVFAISLLTFSVIFSNYPIKPRASTLLVYISTIMILSILVWFHKNFKTEIISLVTWFLFSFNFYFFFIKDPRTHVYIATVPAFLLAGFGIKVVWDLINKELYRLFILLLLVSGFIYLSVFNWTVFVNKNPEYPWFQKTLFGQNLYLTPREYHKKVEGVFGFNNYRHWRQVRDLFDRGCLVEGYNANEKDSVTSFYLNRHQSTADTKALILGAPTIITTEGPHSWVYVPLNKLHDEKYVPIKTFYNKDVLVMQIWGDISFYPEGKMLCE